MSAEIFQFSTAPRRSEKIKTSTRVGEYIGDNLPADVGFGRRGRALQEPQTETCKNSRIRIKRCDAWCHARWVTDYWRGRLDWHSTLDVAQQHGIADSASFPSAENENRFGLVEKWREAVAKQHASARHGSGRVEAREAGGAGF